MSDNLSLPSGENVELAQSLYDQAGQRYEQGDYAAARSLYERSLAIHERLSGVTHPATARCLNGLGMALAAQGDYAAAQPLVERALAIRKQTFGAEHPNTAESLHTLGDITFDRGEFDAGRSLMEQAYEIRQRVLGAEHAETIESMRILAGMLAYRGDRARAEQLLTQALSIAERAFGEHDRDTAKVLNALGVLWAADKSTYSRARAVYERALAINEQVLGPSHPRTALSLNNLAAVLADMGEDAVAISLLERSLAVHEQVRGAKHPTTAFVLINLADIYKRQRNYAAARLLLERALIIREQSLGAQHPATVTSLRKLVGVLENLHKQGDERAMLIAIPLYRCLKAIQASDARPNPVAAEQLHERVGKLEAELNCSPLSAADQADLQTVRDLSRQANAKYEQGDYASAQSMLEQALAIQERVLGENHLDHVELIKKLAQAKKRQGQYSATLPAMQRVADIHMQVLGPGHPTTQLALTDLSLVYDQEYGRASSLPLLESILEMKEKALADDFDIRMTRESIDRIKARLKKSDEEALRLSRSEKMELALATLPPERQALLAGMDEINWHSLHHAYGPADDVPNLLRLLLSDDKSVRDEAWQELYSNVWHQNDIYEATAYVVPFMLRMLTYDGPPGRACVLGFLTTVAEGCSGLEPYVQSEEDTNRWREILAKKGQALETELRKGRSAVEATCRAVSEGVPIYFELLNHEDAEIRHLSLDALACSRERAGEIVPRLRAWLPTVQDADTQAKVTGALNALMDDGPEAQRFFTDLMQRGENERITLMAALALIRRACEHTPDSAVDIVLNAVQELGQVRRSVSQEDPAAWEAIESRFYPGWRWVGYLTTMSALVQLGQARAVAILLRMLPLLQDSTIAREAVSVLLDLVFNDGRIQHKSTASIPCQPGLEMRRKTQYWEPEPQPLREASSLTDMQRTVLAAIAVHDAVWEEEHDLLKLYGLPISRQELRQFIA